MSSPYGFQEWGDPDPSVLITADLTSLSTSRGLATTKGSGAGNINFNSNGVLLGANAAIVLPALTAAEIAQLDNGGCMTVWVGPSWFSSAGSAGNEYLFMGATNSAQTNYISAVKGYLSAAIGQRNADGTFSNAALLTALGKTTPARCDWVWTNDLLFFYINGFLMTINKWKSKAVGQFSYNTLGGFGTGSLLARLYKYQLSTRPVRLMVHPATRDMVMFGHSFTVGMDYSSHSTDLNAAIGGTGTLSIGPQGGAIYNIADAAGLAVIQSSLARRGIGIGGGRIFNYGIGGTNIWSGTNNVSTQMDNAIAAGHRSPSTIILYSGLNDVLGASGSVMPAQFKTDFQNAINKATGTMKCGRIIIPNMISTYMNSVYNSPAILSRIDSGNDMIAQLEIDNPGVVKKADAFTTLGGHYNMIIGPSGQYESDVIVDNIHPINNGYRKIGECVGDVMYGFIR